MTASVQGNTLQPPDQELRVGLETAEAALQAKAGAGDEAEKLVTAESQVT
jgi:hypothetical protein